MKNTNIPPEAELPSMAKLIKSTILAIVIAVFTLVTVVLPAEYGIDPTGIGKFIGLSKMGEIKVSLTKEIAAEKNNREEPSPQDAIVPPRDIDVPADKVPQEEIKLSLIPNEGKEIKLTMKKGEKVEYVWWTDGGPANFDTHADSKKLQINYHSYEKGTLARQEGILTAEFDGKHGWFWRNRTAETMTITLQVRGDYSDIKKI